jgi:GNAT superfamily N-acetyltransferase
MPRERQSKPRRRKSQPEDRGSKTAAGPEGHQLRFAAVTKATRADFEKLFEAKGGPKYCWCMVWRDMPDRQHASNADRKAEMLAHIEAGTPVGILAYAEGEPVGWCSVAPRESLRRLSPQQDDSEAGVWSIVCFYVPRALRGGGLAAALLEAAVKHAFEQGAKAVEAYPVDEDSPSYRFMGFRGMYGPLGFRETGMAGSRRHVVRLERP